MQLIDLHTHTTASDGIYNPSALIDLALSNKVSVLAITDHDTVGGLEEAVQYSIGKALTLIPGIEFSVDYSGGTLHLVGLFIDYTNRSLCNEISRLQEIRDNRIYRILDDLESHHIHIPISEVQDEAKGAAMGRPHVARVLVRHGYGPDIMDIFKNYLVKGKPGYAKKEKISLDRAINLIWEAKGIPILAHPVTLNFPSWEDFDKQLRDYVDRGLEGIEAYATLHSPEQAERFRELGEKYNLVLSGGSDFHGDKNEVIGCWGQSPVPEDLYEKLIKRR